MYRLDRNILALPICLLCITGIHAQPAPGWPIRPVTLVHPLTSGGPGDIEFRPYQPRLLALLGQPVILDFKPGGNTTIGTGYVAKAKPDGYTHLLTTSAYAIHPALTPNLPYDSIRDFDAVSVLTKRAMVLGVRGDFPGGGFRDYIAYARANPGKLNWGAASQGGVTHLVGAWLHRITNTEATFVYYKGSAQYVIDLVAGRIDAAPVPLSMAAPHLKTGKMKAIALLTANRIAALPGTRPIAEQGYPDYEYPSWLGVLAPAGTPPEIVGTFSRALANAVQSPELQSGFERDAITPIGNTPAEFRASLVREIAHWKRLVADLKIEPGDK